MPAADLTIVELGRSHLEEGNEDASHEIARLARSQHGVVSHRQLKAIGLGRGAIRYRLAHARLWRVHAGVYAVGPARLSRLGQMHASVLAVPSGVISHRSAAVLLGLLPGPTTPVHVTTAASVHSERGLCVHRRTELEPIELDVHREIPCTSIARTLLDVAGSEVAATLRRAIREAEYQRLLNIDEVAAVLALRPTRQGRRHLASSLGDLGSLESQTRSWLERRFKSLCRRSGLPAPEFNVSVLTPAADEFIVDCLWLSLIHI